jgi:hypothetical protein
MRILKNGLDGLWTREAERSMDEGGRNTKKK